MPGSLRPASPIPFGRVLAAYGGVFVVGCPASGTHIAIPQERDDSSFLWRGISLHRHRHLEQSRNVQFRSGAAGAVPEPLWSAGGTYCCTLTSHIAAVAPLG